MEKVVLVKICPLKPGNIYQFLCLFDKLKCCLFLVTIIGKYKLICSWGMFFPEKKQVLFTINKVNVAFQFLFLSETIPVSEIQMSSWDNVCLGASSKRRFRNNSSRDDIFSKQAKKAVF
jgi:hypothetical protein